MKRFCNLSMMLLAGLAFTACSSDNDVTENNTPMVDGESYVAFQLFLPTTTGSMTRANDVFDDGTIDEYQVKNGTLVLFQKASAETEDQATFCGAYSLSNVATKFATVGTTTDQITTEGTVTTKLDGSKITKDNLLAYVVLNDNGKFTSPTADGITVNASDADKSVNSSTTFADFKAYTLNALGDASTGFVMTNSPVSSTVGGATSSTGDVTVLAALDKLKIFATAAQAENNPAGDVYVERAAVKVTVSKAASLTELKLTNKNTVSYTLEGWALGNTNQKYFNTRKAAKAWGELKAGTTEGTPATARQFRFVSGSAIEGSVYRTYWAEDVNYTTDNASTDFSTTAPAAASVTNAMASNAYTFENTFDVARMMQRNTTYVVVKAQFNSGTSFYVSKTGDVNEIITDVKTYIHTKLYASNYTYKAWYDAKTENRIDAVTLPTTAGEADITAVTVQSGGDAFPLTAADLNTMFDFSYYADGLAYYNVRIRHFADDETPWNRSLHNSGSIAEAYQKHGSTGYSADEQSQNFLGRYGLVRNNWYQIEIDNVRSIGDPVPTATDDKADDEVENYISLKIHVLPWAKRVQTVTL